MNKLIKYCTAFTLGTLIAYSVAGHAYSCKKPKGYGSSIVHSGDYHFDVIDKCGKPLWFGTVGGVLSGKQVMLYKSGGRRQKLIFQDGKFVGAYSTGF